MIAGLEAPVDRRVETYPETEAYRVYEALRRDIRSGRVNPGAPLRTEWLKKTYEASTSPLREALARLHAEYYVSAEGKRGFRVAVLLRDDFVDLIELRRNLESAAFRKSIANRSEQWEARVLLAHHALSKARVSELGDFERVEWREARHRRFHMELLSECGSTWLLRAYDQAASHAERYARITQRDKVMDPAYLDLVDEEHRNLMEIAFAGETQKALDLLISHRERTHDAVLAALT
jgi:GntR family transcriptional regulator, carbon starvation induced regulator